MISFNQIKKTVCLITKSGDENVELLINYDEECETVSLFLKFKDEEYYVEGNNYLWLDSFAKLQNMLPNEIKIKSCLMCRHGNMCPVGNKPGEIFCTKDVEISQKSDLYFYTEDNAEREKRLRFYTDTCNDYQMQREEFFTYNDFLYWLNEMK